MCPFSFVSFFPILCIYIQYSIYYLYTIQRRVGLLVKFRSYKLMDLRPSERESLSPISIRLLRVLFSPRGLLKRARHVV